MEIDKIDNNYPLAKRWALKENQELGEKDGGKRIKQQEFILSGEIEQDDVSKVSMIQNWISRYHKEFKEKATKCAQKALEEVL
ncbi:32798_t:CDS:2, partial [Gigaspora margarita]